MRENSEELPPISDGTKRTWSCRTRVRRHAKRWKNVYELIGICAVVAASVFGFFAVRQTTESLEIAKKEFDVRNRPRIIPLDAFLITAPRMSGTDSKDWLLTINIKNESDLPAQLVYAFLKLFRNQSADSALVHKFIMLRYVGVNETVKLKFSLPDSVLIKDGDTPTNRHIDLTVKYGRFASEESDRKYKTIWSFYIDPENFNILPRYTKFE